MIGRGLTSLFQYPYGAKEEDMYSVIVENFLPSMKHYFERKIKILADICTERKGSKRDGKASL
jgi:hypothetical protein